MDKIFIFQISNDGNYGTVMCPPATLVYAGTPHQCLVFLNNAVDDLVLHDDESTSVNK